MKNETFDCTIKNMDGQSTIQVHDNDYPALLREIHDPPPTLYIRGKLANIADRPVLAVVGSRKATIYGRQVVKKLIEPIARAGIVIVSGLAHGIDGAAHEAAIASGGVTIGVLGTPITKIYPVQHERLARQMIHSGGALISETGPTGVTHKGSFPKRNRIIAGMAHATLVVEAAVDSGSLITAQSALEENREVLAVPGPITSLTSAGTNGLIKQGARPITDARDILEVFAELFPTLVMTQAPNALTKSQADYIDELSTFESTHIDKILASATINLPELQAQLAILELEGIIKMTAPGWYLRLQ